jgi:hypothetical protein
MQKNIMNQIQTYTYPQGQQLSDGELIQVRVQQSSRLVFKDAFFHELQEGDVYIIPTQLELPPATDTEILDYLLDRSLGWTVLDNWFKIWDKNTMEDLLQSNYDPEATDLRSAFREAVTELIHNNEL